MSEDEPSYSSMPSQSPSEVLSSLSYYDLEARKRGRERMGQIAKELADSSEPFETTPRKILELFGYKKRGHRVRAIIRSVVEESGMTMLPALNAVSLDDRVLLSLKKNGGQGSSVVREVMPAEGYDSGAPKSSSESGAEDDAARVGALPTARRGVISTSGRDRLDSAIAKMTLYDYSQLPVLAGNRVDGVISWKCLGLAFARGEEVSGSDQVRQFMQRRVTVCRADEVLLDVIRSVIREEFVLVQDERDSNICGIVTTTDLTDFLQETYQAFALLSEIEALLRQFLNREFKTEDFVAAKNPADEGREVRSAEDLTLGEYKRLLENKERWARLKLRLERKEFLSKLEQVATIRNGVMHFAEDGVTDEDVQELERFLAALRRLLV